LSETLVEEIGRYVCGEDIIKFFLSIIDIIATFQLGSRLSEALLRKFSKEGHRLNWDEEFLV